MPVTPLSEARLYGDETIASPYGILELQDTFITDESSQKLFFAMDLQRASQAYIWSTPIVSFYTWRKQQDKVYGTGKVGEFAVLNTLKEKRGVVTGNLTTPYILSFADLSQGALRIDYPKGQTAGGVLDLWQRPLTDMGLTGPDQGQGGSYVIVGPEDDITKYQKDKKVRIYQSATNTVFIGLRLLNPSPEAGAAFKRSLQLGLVGGKMHPAVFKENLDLEWSATAPRGLEYWKLLSEILSAEPVREQDKVWMAMLEPLGIKKGEKFAPNQAQQKVLLEGAALGELMARNLQINPRYTSVYWEGTQWYKSFDFHTAQSTDYKVELDERTTWFYEAVTSTKGMLNPSPGKGQVYMTTKRDNQGRLLRADKTYKLRIPKDVPVAQFWSLTLYSENTRRPYDNQGTSISSATLGSRSEQLKRNADGSVDLYVGAKAPAGWESNYLKTLKQDGWFVIFRLYGPEQPFFDKSFSLTDFEMLDAD